MRRVGKSLFKLPLDGFCCLTGSATEAHGMPRQGKQVRERRFSSGCLAASGKSTEARDWRNPATWCLHGHRKAKSPVE